MKPSKNSASFDFDFTCSRLHITENFDLLITDLSAVAIADREPSAFVADSFHLCLFIFVIVIDSGSVRRGFVAVAAAGCVTRFEE